MKSAKHTAHDQHNTAAASIAIARMHFIQANPKDSAEALAEVRRWEILASATKETVLSVLSK